MLAGLAGLGRLGMHKVRGVNSQQLVLVQPALTQGGCRPREILPEAFRRVGEAMNRGSEIFCLGQVNTLMSCSVSTSPSFFLGLLFYFILFPQFFSTLEMTQM